MNQPQPADVEQLYPWASNTDPSDVLKQHVEEITRGPAAYTVVQGGTMDGERCRTPHGSWNPMVQTWESNRAVRLENVGDTDVVNPWLSNGRNTFRDLDEIVATTCTPGMSGREKALALYYREVVQRFHCHTGDAEG